MKPVLVEDRAGRRRLQEVEHLRGRRPTRGRRQRSRIDDRRMRRRRKRVDDDDAGIGEGVGRDRRCRAAPRRARRGAARRARSRRRRPSTRRRPTRRAASARPARTCRPARPPDPPAPAGRAPSAGASAKPGAIFSVTGLRLAARSARARCRADSRASPARIRCRSVEVVHPVEIGRDEQIRGRAALDLPRQRRAGGVRHASCARPSRAGSAGAIASSAVCSDAAAKTRTPAAGRAPAALAGRITASAAARATTPTPARNRVNFLIRRPILAQGSVVTSAIL